MGHQFQRAAMAGHALGEKEKRDVLRQRSGEHAARPFDAKRVDAEYNQFRILQRLARLS